MPPKTQPHGIAPNDAAANLALATHISTQLATPQQAPQAPTQPQEAQQAPDLTPEVEALQKQVEDLTKKVNKDPKDDLAEMKKMIEDALAEDDTKDAKQN